MMFVHIFKKVVMAVIHILKGWFFSYLRSVNIMNLFLNKVRWGGWALCLDFPERGGVAAEAALQPEQALVVVRRRGHGNLNIKLIYTFIQNNRAVYERLSVWYVSGVTATWTPKTIYFCTVKWSLRRGAIVVVTVRDNGNINSHTIHFCTNSCTKCIVQHDCCEAFLPSLLFI